MRERTILLILALGMSSCARQTATSPASPGGAAVGAALVEVSGDKQVTRIGAALDQPVVVQVNNAQGTAVQGASVSLSGVPGVNLDPAGGLTDASGQFSSQVSAPGISGHFEVVATTNAGKVQLKIDEIALGYEETLGRQLNAQYCARCHDPESTPERVSNMDNLDPKPHAFTEGDTFNKINDADLVAVISHGGAALNKSASMPPFGYTLSQTDILALSSYIRAVSDPPYRAPGRVYVYTSK
jgi:mono/diheme cytochrome c family protein